MSSSEVTPPVPDGDYCVRFQNKVDLFGMLHNSVQHPFYFLKQAMMNPQNNPNAPGCVPQDWIQPTMWQILYQVKRLHNSGVVHGDLQFSNLTMSWREVVMLQDFGSVASSNTPCANHGVGHRWYRSPELLLDTHYNEATDMWSLGCILYELYTNQPLFPGANLEHQVELIVTQLGALPVSLSSAPQDPALVPKPHYPTENVVRDINDDPEACDLLKQLLAYEPSQRITASAALSHPFFASIQAAMQNVPQHLDAAFKDQRRLFDWAQDMMGGHAIRGEARDEEKDAAPAEGEEGFVQQDYADVAAYELDYEEEYSEYEDGTICSDEYETIDSEDDGVQYSEDEQY